MILESHFKTKKYLMDAEKIYGDEYLDAEYNPIEYRRKTNLINLIIKTIDELVETEDYMVLRYSSVRYIEIGLKVKISDPNKTTARSKNSNRICTIQDIRGDEIDVMCVNSDETFTLDRTGILPSDLHKTVLSSYFSNLYLKVKEKAIEFFKDDIDLLNCLCGIIGIDIETGYHNIDLQTKYKIYKQIKSLSKTDYVDFKIL